MKRINLHNLRAFIKHNPNATAADYAREIKESRKTVELIGKAYSYERTKNGRA